MLIQLTMLLALGTVETQHPPIVSSMPAFLGIGFGFAEGHGLVVSEVRPNTAAMKAGLVAGDVIVAFNGTTLDQAEQLRSLVGSKQAGDKVDVLIRREGAERIVKVTLGRPPLPEELLAQRDPPRVQGGTINGAGQIVGGIESIQNLVIPGTMQIDGYLKLGFSGLLDMAIPDRNNPASIQVSGDVELSGMLFVAKSNIDFKEGDAFEIIQGAKSIKGGFNTLWLPTLPANLSWRVDIDNVARGRDRDKDGKNDVTLVIVSK